MTRARHIATAAALVCATACRPSPPSEPVQPAAARAAAAARATSATATSATATNAPATSAAQRHWPPTQAELPTTDAALATSTFLGLYDLAVATGRREAKPPVALVSLLQTHAIYFGALDDYDAALAAAERAVRTGPRAPDVYLQRASARQSLHQFAEALADLDRAAALGADRDGVDGARAGILQALGRYEEALAIRTRLADKRATTHSLGALAVLVGEMGRTAEAEALFARAGGAFADVSPFPLAWLYFQAGLVEERAGRPSSARELYEAAHARLPIYAPVAGHLASLRAMTGDVRGAILLLEPVAQSSDDPEYWAQLGALYTQAGDARGTGLIARARRRWDALVARHPAAFADHAARFFLGPGHDPARALALAQRNLAARKTRDAYDLVIEAASAAGARPLACATANEALRLPYANAALALHASEAFARCGQRTRADAVLAEVTAR